MLNRILVYRPALSEAARENIEAALRFYIAVSTCMIITLAIINLVSFAALRGGLQ